MLRNYIELTKPRTVWLLVFTALIAGGVASLKHPPFRPFEFILALAGITLAVMGSNALTCYVDRDIDARMERTKNRPLPSGRIKPAGKALYCGITLVAAGAAAVYIVRPIAVIYLLFGALDSVIIYNFLTKRKSPWNIVLASPAGGMPALTMWTAVTGRMSYIPVAMLMMIIFWTPAHIWSLALYYREDYKKAGVPMLPVVSPPEKTVYCIAGSNLLLVLFALSLISSFGLLYTILAVLLGILVAINTVKMLAEPTRENAWKVFKLTSPYLAVLFLAMLLDALLVS